MDSDIHDNSRQAGVKNFLLVNPILSNLTGGGEEVLLKILEVLIDRKQDISLIGKLPSGNIFDNLSLSCVKQIPYNYVVDFRSKRFQVYRQLFSQLKTRRKLRREVGEVDLEISTQYPMHFINTGKKRVAYVHFPETLTYARRPAFRHRWFWKLYYWPFTFLIKWQVKQIDLLMCNSCYTQRAIMDSWGRSAELVYPPVDIEAFKPVRKEFLVVSVGRFTPVKNYELVVEVARRMPTVSFVIVGRKHLGDPYFDKIAALKPDNLTLIADMSRGDVSVLLGRAKVYLHSMVGEHFGISVVEAMAAGCIPVVHNSGGPKEVVGDVGFLYSSVEECVGVVGEALRSAVSPGDVVERVKMFSADNFKKNFVAVLEKNGFL